MATLTILPLQNVNNKNSHKACIDTILDNFNNYFYIIISPRKRIKETVEVVRFVINLIAKLVKVVQ